MTVEQLSLEVAMMATRTTDTVQTPKSRSTQHVDVTKANQAAVKRLAKGGVMLPRAETIIPATLRPGSSRCQCGRCGLVFSALSNFDFHQLLDDEGNVQCWEPASIGLVDRDGVWGRPGDSSRFEKDMADGD